MEKRRVLATLAACSLLALGGTSAGLAGVGGGSSAACERAQQRLGQLEATAAGLTDRAGTLEGLIASGELNARQLVRAERLLGQLENRLQRLEERIVRLEDRIAERCTPEPDPGPGEETVPGGGSE